MTTLPAANLPCRASQTTDKRVLALRRGNQTQRLDINARRAKFYAIFLEISTTGTIVISNELTSNEDVTRLDRALVI